MAPVLDNPFRVWVVMGPFIGWKGTVGSAISRTGSGWGWLFVELDASGSPRFQAKASRSPKMWQLEQEASPLPEVPTAS